MEQEIILDLINLIDHHKFIMFFFFKNGPFFWIFFWPKNPPKNHYVGAACESAGEACESGGNACESILVCNITHYILLVNGIYKGSKR